MKIDLLFRAPGEFFSVEEFFGSVVAALPGEFDVTSRFAPRSGAKPKSVIANTMWVWQLRSSHLIHVAGDIHYAVLGAWGRPVVLTILDLRFIEEASRLKRIVFWWVWLFLPSSRATCITVISQFTKERLLSLCRIDPRKVRVIPCCVGSEFSPVTKFWSQGTVRLLHVGTTNNKNLLRVAEACTGLPIDLFIIGRMTDLQHEFLVGHAVNYKNESGLTKEQVVTAYNECDMVVFVSTYEGFGIPILEAQAVGRPVITSDISPMSDVAGEGALLVDPFDVQAIQAGLLRLISEPQLREDLVQKGFENVKKYSAKSVAAQYAALYREVLEK